MATDDAEKKNIRDNLGELLDTLTHDREDHLLKIDDYLHGRHCPPWIPPSADDEYKLLVERSVTNVFPLIVNVAAQGMFVDSFRPGREVPNGEIMTPEWRHWQQSRMDSRQIPVHRAALSYGHSFTVTEAMRGKVQTRGLSPLRTVAHFEDPANDIDPIVALHVLSFPTKHREDELILDGRGYLWTRTYKYDISWDGGFKEIRVNKRIAHGSPDNPITRFTTTLDLEGRTIGVIEPLIPNQDRLNQTIFDLLLAQSYSSIKVRYASGLVPPVQLDEDGEPVLDEFGQPIPVPMNHNARRFIFSEDPDVKFGTLDETPLDGFLEAGKATFEQISALSQTPPHYLMGQIANLSAEALKSAEASLNRKLAEYRQGFGESWERVFQLAAGLNGDTASVEDYSGEVVWRDVDFAALSQVADGLGKLQVQLGIPPRGLWPRVPGVTSQELQDWERLAREGDPLLSISDAMQRSNDALLNQESFNGEEA